MNKCTAALLILALLVCSLPLVASDLDLRPIRRTPEPVGKLRPKLAWMTREKVRCMWIGNDLFEKFEGGSRTLADVMVYAGFNLVCLGMDVNTNGKFSGVPDVPLEPRFDRSRSKDMETRLAPNVKAARRVGLKMMVRWKYGSSHLEPYRKYRSPKGELAKYTCCPADETYIGGQHFGKWAVKAAQGGADGIVLDMEMYQSDTGWPEGPCMCDDCFGKYLRRYAKGWKAVYDSVPAESRGQWLKDRQAYTHYTDSLSSRMEKMYDAIRARCQRINPDFVFGTAPVLYIQPAPSDGHRGAPVERGLGTSSVPCLVFSENEYPTGPYSGTYLCVKWIREDLPALFVPGAYVHYQSPQTAAENAVISGLYADGWWVYYGTALLTNTTPELNTTDGYGRVKGTSAQDYLTAIKTAHKKITALLPAPTSQWPEPRDGKLIWLTQRLADAEAEAAKTGTEEAKKVAAEAKDELERYKIVVAGGGS